jgi:hypothetical protein
MCCIVVVSCSDGSTVSATTSQDLSPITSVTETAGPASIQNAPEATSSLPSAAAAAPVESSSTVESTPAPPTVNVEELRAAIVQSAESAAAEGVRQAVVIIDRSTGEVLVEHQAGTTFNSESITKLFTAAYYLVQAGGAPGADLEEDLHLLIARSDNAVQIRLWRANILSSVRERYDLGSISNAPGSGRAWGSDRITASAVAAFLYRASNDPIVGPKLFEWMAESTPTGTDGFNQAFGFNALSGNHGSKQGWSDPGWRQPNLHSAGWTDRYVGAILQTTTAGASYAVMRAASTRTAALLAP